jgi:hypothetical protein
VAYQLRLNLSLVDFHICTGFYGGLVSEQIAQLRFDRSEPIQPLSDFRDGSKK